MKTVRFFVLSVVLTVFMAGPMAFAGDKPTFDVDWYGYFKLDGSYDQNQTSHGNFAMWVNPQSNGQDDEQFNMTANQTQFGLKIKSDYNDFKLGGRLEFDLYGGAVGATVPQNKALLMLRHGYFTIQSGNTMLLAGQTWDIISPLNPPTLNYSVLWGCGNIGYRRPQVSLWHTFELENQSSFTFAAGMFRTIGDDLGFTLNLATEAADGTDDGTDAGIPSVQGLLDFNYTLPSDVKIRVGGSGMWEQLKAESATSTNYEKYTSWAGVGHFQVMFPNDIGFSGEYYQGENLKSYYGGINNASSIDGLTSWGFWGSAWMKPTPQWKVVAGYGADNPEENDLAVGNRMKNNCAFGNIQYYVVPGAAIGLEISQWQTEYKGGDTVKNLRAQTSFKMAF